MNYPDSIKCTIESKSGLVYLIRCYIQHGDTTETVDCGDTLDVCQYPRVKFALSNMGNYWISTNKEQKQVINDDQEAYPDDSPAHMKDTAIALAYPFPYLFDETQEVARAYQATCTPDLFVFDSHLNLVYRGQLDDSRPGNKIPVTGSSVREALYCLLNNQSISLDQKPSLGCNIKWKDTLNHS